MRMRPAILSIVVLLLAFGLAAAACGGGGETVVPTVTPTFTPGPVATSPSSDGGATAPTGGGDVEQGMVAVTTGICAVCHTIAGTSAQASVGPELTTIGTTAATRKSGMSAEAYIRESIEEPGAHVVEGFANAMPPGLKASLGADYESVIAYLMSLK